MEGLSIVLMLRWPTSSMQDSLRCHWPSCALKLGADCWSKNEQKTSQHFSALHARVPKYFISNDE
jgi:hypothetical protein